MEPNFSDVISEFKDLDSTKGIMIIDTQGLVMASSFQDESFSDYAAPLYLKLISSIHTNMKELDETTNQVCLVMNDKLILIQPVFDLILIVYTEKQNLDALQQKIKSAVLLLQQISKHEI
jgi:predicted regulator of Ras-like GTPase activity (Roadblock/LC7/MglB family)